MKKSYNLKKIHELTDNDKDFLRALLKAFLEEVPKDAIALKEAIENKDFKLVSQISHRVRPTIDLFQLTIMKDLEGIQDWARKKKQHLDVSTKVNKVVSEIDAVAEALKKDYNL